MLIFRLFEDTRHIGPMAERQTIAGAVKCVACHFHSMPLRAGENRGLPKPAALCKPIMHERPCFETPTEVHCREAQRSKVYSYGWCCLKAFCVGVQKARELWQQLALHTLLHPAALLHKKLPLVSFLALGPPLKNTLIREATIEARSCTVHADSGFQSVLCEESRFADLIILERQVPTTIHFCLFPEGRTCPTNMIELQIFLARDGHLRLTCYRRHRQSFLGW